MQIIKLLKEHSDDLGKLFDLKEYSNEHITLVRTLIKMAYNEGLADGRADVKQELSDFAEKLGYFLQIEKQD